MSTTPDVQVGQVWRDNDTRMGFRELRITEVGIEKNGEPAVKAWDGVAYRTILVRRFRPTSTGYLLVRGSGHNPAAPSVSDTAAATITEAQRQRAIAALISRDGGQFGEVHNVKGYYAPRVDAVLAALGLTVTERSEVLTDKADQ